MAWRREPRSLPARSFRFFCLRRTFVLASCLQPPHGHCQVRYSFRRECVISHRESARRFQPLHAWRNNCKWLLPAIISTGVLFTLTIVRAGSRVQCECTQGSRVHFSSRNPQRRRGFNYNAIFLASLAPLWNAVRLPLEHTEQSGARTRVLVVAVSWRRSVPLRFDPRRLKEPRPFHSLLCITIHRLIPPSRNIASTASVQISRRPATTIPHDSFLRTVDICLAAASKCLQIDLKW